MWAAGCGTVYRTTALTIAPQFKITDLEAPIAIEPHDETGALPMKPLFLIVHVKIGILAPMRARGAYKCLQALKQEASVTTGRKAVEPTKHASPAATHCLAFTRVSSLSTAAQATRILDGKMHCTQDDCTSRVGLLTTQVG